MAFVDICLVARRLGSTVTLLLSIAALLLRRVTTLLLGRCAITALLLGRVSLLLTTVTALLLAVAWRGTRRWGELVLATVATLLRRSTVSGSSTLRTVRLLVLGVVRGIDCTEDQLENL
jgi:hypothetical protein